MSTRRAGRMTPCSGRFSALVKEHLTFLGGHLLAEDYAKAPCRGLIQRPRAVSPVEEPASSVRHGAGPRVRPLQWRLKRRSISTSPRGVSRVVRPAAVASSRPPVWDLISCRCGWRLCERLGASSPTVGGSQRSCNAVARGCLSVAAMSSSTSSGPLKTGSGRPRTTASQAPSAHVVGPHIGQLRRNLTGRFGSASAGRPREFTAGKQTPNLDHRIADVHGRQWATQSRLSVFPKAARRSGQPSTGLASTKQPFVGTGTRPLPVGRPARPVVASASS